MSRFPPKVVELFARRSSDGPAPDEALIMLKAFMRVKNPSLRQTIIELVEKIAAMEAKR